MILKFYAVYDAAVQAFMNPFISRTDGEAQRSFISAAADKKHLGANAKDYTLFHVGEWDDNAGMVVPVQAPRRLITALEALAIEQADFERERSIGS